MSASRSQAGDLRGSERQGTSVSRLRPLVEERSPARHKPSLPSEGMVRTSIKALHGGRSDGSSLDTTAVGDKKAPASKGREGRWPSEGPAVALLHCCLSPLRLPSSRTINTARQPAAQQRPALLLTSLSITLSCPRTSPLDAPLLQPPPPAMFARLSPPLRFLLALVLASALSLLPAVRAHSIELSPGAKECFFEDLSAKDVVRTHILLRFLLDRRSLPVVRRLPARR
jgi:hypothetical protein